MCWSEETYFVVKRELRLVQNCARFVFCRICFCDCFRTEQKRSFFWKNVYKVSLNTFQFCRPQLTFNNKIRFLTPTQEENLSLLYKEILSHLWTNAVVFMKKNGLFFSQRASQSRIVRLKKNFFLNETQLWAVPWLAVLEWETIFCCERFG